MAAHSRGHMTPWLLPSFSHRVAPDFIRFSQAVLSVSATVNIRQAVATHSDYAEHSAERPEGECELGNDLLPRSTLREGF